MRDKTVISFIKPVLPEGKSYLDWFYQAINKDSQSFDKTLTMKFDE
jgi:hypothetical protein